jgi:hypothetical protein
LLFVVVVVVVAVVVVVFVVVVVVVVVLLLLSLKDNSSAVRPEKHRSDSDCIKRIKQESGPPVIQYPGDRYNIGTCCEGQGARLYASLHEFVFSVPAAPSPATAPDPNAALYVDLYTPASIALAPLLSGGEFVVGDNSSDGRVWWVGNGTSVKNYLTQCAPCGSTSAIDGCRCARRVPQAYLDSLAEGPLFACGMLPAAGTVTVTTAFPLSDDVTVTVFASAAAPLQLDLVLRMPAWLAAAAVPVLVGGARWPADGVPGSYLHVARQWGAAGTATNVTFLLARALEAHAYTGATQRPPFSRYGFTYGPLLLAFVVATNSSAGAPSASSWNATLDAVALGGVDPTRPADWLLPVGDTNTVLFRIANAPDVVVMPYGDVYGEQFSVYPVFLSAPLPPARAAVDPQWDALPLAANTPAMAT